MSLPPSAAAARAVGTMVAGRSRGKSYTRGYVGMYRGLTWKKYPFIVACDPVNLTVTLGTGANNGLDWYAMQTVPAGPNGLGTFNFSLSFTLNGVNLFLAGATSGSAILAATPNPTEFTNLFDEYRLDKVEIEMFFSSNSFNTSASSIPPTMILVNDYDDANNASSAALEQYPANRMLQFGNSSGSNNGVQKHTVWPKTQLSVLTTSGTSASLDSGRKRWYDTATPTIDFFGVKGAIYNPLSTGSNAFVGFVTFRFKYFLCFRNAR